nr:retrotransposon Orf1 [Tanacetum cinerariifolium]
MVREFGVFDDDVHRMFHDILVPRPIHSETIVDWSFFTQHGLARGFFESINTDAFFGPQWVNLLQISEPVYRELVREFFASFEFQEVASRYDPEFKGVSFRLGGETKAMSLLEFGWRVGLYSEGDSLESRTRLSMQRALIVKVEDQWRAFWPSIWDGEFVFGGTSVKKIRDPRVRLAYRCIMMTIMSHKESTQSITAIDMFYLYCIYAKGVVCYIPFWLARYLRRHECDL